MGLVTGLAASLRTSPARMARTMRRGARREARAATASAALTRAAAEALEGRVLLSLSVEISGPPTVLEGGTYTLNLSASGTDAGSVNRWDIDWGDGSDPDANGTPGESVAGGGTASATHVFAAGVASARVTATATTTGGVTSNTAALGLDPAFAGGTVLTDFDGRQDLARALAVQPDGKVIAAGITQLEPGSSDQNFAAARYNTDGSLDNTFDGDGKVRIPGYHGDAWTVAVAYGDKILLGGLAYSAWDPTVPDGFNWHLARLNADGSLDTTFGGDGIVALSWSPSPYWDVLRDMIVLDDGDIVAVGEAYDTSLGRTVAAVARFNPDGMLDTRFSGDGMHTLSFFGNGDSYLFGVARQPGSTDGKLYVAGHGSGTGSGGWDTAVARLDASGVPDAAFGSQGLVTTDWNGAGGNDYGNDLAVQADGKPVIAAQAADAAGNSRMAVARYTAAGALDTTFGGTGKVFAVLGGGSNATEVAVQADGNVLLGGYGYGPNGTNDFALARFNAADGTPDPTLGLNGLLTSDFAGRGDNAYAMVVLDDGRVVLAGQSSSGDSQDFGVARFHPDNAAGVIPAAPTGLMVTPTSSPSQMTLAWTDNSLIETQFEVERANNSAFTEGVAVFPVPASKIAPVSHTDTGLTSGTTFYYRARAVNAAGTSDYAPGSGGGGGAGGSPGTTPSNTPPSVGTPTASPNPVTETTTSLTAQGSDDDGEDKLTYTWATVSSPAALQFSRNGTYDARGTIVTFSAAGQYAFQVTVTDAEGLAATSETVNVTVEQVPTYVGVPCTGAAILHDATHAFAAVAYDQFGYAMPASTFAWSVSGAGSIDSSGVYTAPASDVGAGHAAVTAIETASGISGSAALAYGTVVGTVFEDLDEDGQIDVPGERGVAGWRVYIDVDGDGYGDHSDLTDGGGNYGLDNPPPPPPPPTDPTSSGSGGGEDSTSSGSDGGEPPPPEYAVYAEAGDGMKFTVPSDGRHAITLGAAVAGKNFGILWAAAAQPNLDIIYATVQFDSFVKRDPVDGLEQYKETQWVDPDGKPGVVDDFQRSYPLAYRRSTPGSDSKVTVSATFRLRDAPPPGEYVIKGRGTGLAGGVLTWEKKVTPQKVPLGWELRALSVVSNEKLGDTIDDADLTIEWTITEVNTGKVRMYGSSKNHIYVTGGNPRIGTYESIIALGSKAAKGLRSRNPGEEEGAALGADKKVIDKVWAEFADRDVRTVGGTRLWYYGNFREAANKKVANALLEKGDTECYAWVDLLKRVLVTQGVGYIYNQEIATPPPGTPPAEGATLAPGLLPRLVVNPGAKGQGDHVPTDHLGNELNYFVNHAVVLWRGGTYGDFIFDPSYGGEPLFLNEGPPDYTLEGVRTAWEDRSIHSFRYFWIHPDGRIEIKNSLDTKGVRQTTGWKEF